MQISTINSYNTSFKAHRYKVYPKTSRVLVQTDNKPYLGEKPMLVSNDFDDFENNELEMEKEGKYYSQYLPANNPIIKYHIHYKDTGNLDLKDGKEYEIPNRELSKTAALYLRKQHRQPVFHAIKQGKAVGKIVYKENIGYKDSDFINGIKEPTIIITEHSHRNINNPNIVGLIYTSDDAGTFSHLASQLRVHMDIAGAIYQPEIIDRLRKLEGKNVEIEFTSDSVNFKETDKTSDSKTFPTIIIPKMKYSDKILLPDNYESDLIGAKAVNLKRLDEMAKQGKIDVIVPKSIGLPYGYISRLLKENGDLLYDKSNNKIRQLMNNLRHVLLSNGICSHDLIIRSAFNGEDLPDYSAAGIYNSQFAFINCEEERANNRLFTAIEVVARSLNSKKAIESRRKYNIPDEAIKPGIIIQNCIEPDYKFTLYTDDGKGNLKIDLYSDKGWKMEDYTMPHVFTYNRKTKELTYEAVQLEGGLSVTFDEDMNIIGADEVKNDLSSNKKLLEQIKKLAENALAIEKEFGAPQDIEGGLKDDDIYLWQSRNIVKSC